MVSTTEEQHILDVDKDIQDYREDPVGFMTNVLSLKPEYVWPKMREMAEGIRDHQLVCIRAGHSVSKTFSMGRIVPWFKMCFQPSTVITTAPSDNQVRNQLWREIHAAYASARIPLGGKMTTLAWNVKPRNDIIERLKPEQREQWEKNFAIGFSTQADSSAEHATKMQGWHNTWVLVVIDEACGVMPQIWRTAIEALIIDERCKFVAIGNPTDPECEFAQACYSSDPNKNEGNEPYISDLGFYVITISGMDTPNYKQNKEVVPGLATRAFVDRIVKKYGPDGDGTRYRVKGLFPTQKEGTYYGRKLAAAYKNKRVGDFPWVEHEPVYTFSDTGDMNTATLFVQFLRSGVRVIDDYWDNEGLGLPAWLKMFQGKPYLYGGHFVGPELASGSPGKFQTGKTTIDLAAEHKFHLQPTVKHRFDEGIKATRDILFPLLEINKPNCPTFLKAAAGYGKKKNQALSTDEEAVYHDQPAKTWHRHMCDALRHAAMAYYYMVIGEDVLGRNPAPNEISDDMDAKFESYQWL